jgi:chemotaxis protein MotA
MMAEAPRAKTQKPSEAAEPAKGGKSKGGGVRPDLATLSGVALAIAGILGGLILEKGSIQDVTQVTAAMIVLSGTFGAVLVTTPLPVFLQALKGIRHVFLEHTSSAGATIETLVKFAMQARKNGIVSLESEASGASDPFLRKALNLAVDGTDLNEIRKMMEIDIDLAEQSEEQQARVWESAGGYSPTIGIIGAVLGLIQVMKHLDDISEVGRGIAVAFVATVYGVGFANIVFLPFANKLRARIRQARLLKELILEGVIGIVEGLNPTLIRLKLCAFDQEPPEPAKAPAPKGKATAKAGAPQTAPAGD